MAEITINIAQSVLDEVGRLANESGDTVENLIASKVANAFGTEHATVFQISTTNALIEGVQNKAVTVGDLRAHGDFGLGTFANFAGEMVIIDGEFICVPGHGLPHLANDSDPVPFAVVSAFRPDTNSRSGRITDFNELAATLDSLRASDNFFYAVRLDGDFARVHTRAVCPTKPGAGLADAAQSQAEFRFENVKGSVVGFWFPSYAGTLNVVGWHLHFISTDRSAGGHLLGLSADDLTIQLQTMEDLHVSLPETKEFMRATLDFDSTNAIDQVERAR
jgi:acetolactate decarboxylase